MATIYLDNPGNVLSQNTSTLAPTSSYNQREMKPRQGMAYDNSLRPAEQRWINSIMARLSKLYRVADLMRLRDNLADYRAGDCNLPEATAALVSTLGLKPNQIEIAEFYLHQAQMPIMKASFRALVQEKQSKGQQRISSIRHAHTAKFVSPSVPEETLDQVNTFIIANAQQLSSPGRPIEDFLRKAIAFFEDYMKRSNQSSSNISMSAAIIRGGKQQLEDGSVLHHDKTFDLGITQAHSMLVIIDGYTLGIPRQNDPRDKAYQKKFGMIKNLLNTQGEVFSSNQEIASKFAALSQMRDGMDLQGDKGPKTVIYIAVPEAMLASDNEQDNFLVKLGILHDLFEAIAMVETNYLDQRYSPEEMENAVNAFTATFSSEEFSSTILEMVNHAQSLPNYSTKRGVEAADLWQRLENDFGGELGRLLDQDPTAKSNVKTVLMSIAKEDNTQNDPLYPMAKQLTEFLLDNSEWANAGFKDEFERALIEIFISMLTKMRLEVSGIPKTQWSEHIADTLETLGQNLMPQLQKYYDEAQSNLEDTRRAAHLIGLYAEASLSLYRIHDGVDSLLFEHNRSRLEHLQSNAATAFDQIESNKMLTGHPQMYGEDMTLTVGEAFFKELGLLKGEKWENIIDVLKSGDAREFGLNLVKQISERAQLDLFILDILEKNRGKPLSIDLKAGRQVGGIEIPRMLWRKLAGRQKQPVQLGAQAVTEKEVLRVLDQLLGTPEPFTLTTFKIKPRTVLHQHIEQYFREDFSLAHSL